MVKRLAGGQDYVPAMLALCVAALAVQFWATGQHPISAAARLMGLRPLAEPASVAAVVAVNGVVVLAALAFGARRLTRRAGRRRLAAGWVGLTVLVAAMFGWAPGYRGLAANAFARAVRIRPTVGPAWEEALTWLDDTAPADAVVAAWWDYGGQINRLGKRATIIDEEQNGYWCHLMARHVITGTEEPAHPFLKTRHATHLALSNVEVDNLYWISWIGADADSDRRCRIGSLSRDVGTMTEEGGGQVMTFRNLSGLPMDDELTLRGAAYGAWELHLTQARLRFDVDGRPLGAEVILAGDGLRYKASVREIYVDGESTVFDGADVPGCLYLPTENGDGGVDSVREAVYIPAKVRDSLLVRLYLLDEPSPFFEPVYPVSSSDGSRGPVRIWSISYPPGLEDVPEYLLEDAPDPRVLVP